MATSCYFTVPHKPKNTVPGAQVPWYGTTRNQQWIMTRKLKTALPTPKESPIQYVHIKYVERGRRQNVTEPWTLQHRKPTYLQNKLQTARKITGIRHAKPSKQACFRIPAWLTFGTWTLDYWSPHVKDGIGWCLPMSISSTGSLPHLHHPSNMPPIPPKSISVLICKGLQSVHFDILLPEKIWNELGIQNI